MIVILSLLQNYYYAGNSRYLTGKTIHPQQPWQKGLNGSLQHPLQFRYAVCHLQNSFPGWHSQHKDNWSSSSNKKINQLQKQMEKIMTATQNASYMKTQCPNLASLPLTCQCYGFPARKFNPSTTPTSTFWLQGMLTYHSNVKHIVIKKHPYELRAWTSTFNCLLL